MSIDSFDVVFYTTLFLLPGFIVNEIVEHINPAPKYNESRYFLKCLLYSIVNCAVWCWLYRLVLSCPKLNTIGFWILLLLISLIGSAILGVLIGVIKQKQAIDRFLNGIHIKTIHSTPTAWDYYFSKQEPKYVIITLIDDTMFYGLYSSHSFSSSDQEERDIYVEKLFDEHWKIDNESSGVYIPKEQIKYIEFKEGASNNGRREKH